MVERSRWKCLGLGDGGAPEWLEHWANFGERGKRKSKKFGREGGSFTFYFLRFYLF